MEKLFRKSLEISRALFPATKAERNGKRCQHFSFLFDKSRLLCAAENSLKTHPRNRFNLRNFDIGAKSSCAELILFLRAKSKFSDLNWKKLTIVNVRINLEGQICNSKPCHVCANLLKYLGSPATYFTNDLGEFEKYEV